MTRQLASRSLVAGLGSLLTLGAAGAARANTVWIEAESVRERVRGTITSPMNIKDEASASGGSYIVVAPGNNSQNTPPVTEGLAKYTFSVANDGVYKIWARVKAPNDGDDSFWVRMNSGGWIKWNGMPLNSNWRWVTVKAEGASGPAQFNLNATIDNELQIGFREDNTKLDALVVTDDPSFNPNAALTGPPSPPIMFSVVQGETAVKVSWSAVPGAQSYKLERREAGCSWNEERQRCEGPPFTTIASGLTVHKYTDATQGFWNYRVTAVASTGSSFQPDPDSGAINPSEGWGGPTPFHIRTQYHVLSVTAPMVMIEDEYGSSTAIGAPAGTDSLNAAPAKGRARWDFEVAVQVKAKLWANVVAPNKDQDSFWVRMDDGPWVNWNNIAGCDDIHNSANAGKVMVYDLAPGSHRFEWAYREGGAQLSNIIVVTQNLGTQEQCSD